MIYRVDPDVRRAQTIDKSFYLDEAVWARARERIFARSWQWLGTLDDVAAASSSGSGSAGPLEPPREAAAGRLGALSPRTLLPGLLDEPLVLVRDVLGTLHCLSNVCTHRGNVLVGAPCAAADIACRYHGRRFALDGRLRGMPGFEGVADFPSPRDDLPRLPFGEFDNHAFAAIAPRLTFDEVLGDVRRRMAWLPLAAMREDPARAREYEFDAHWALYVENYLEGLHIPYVHPALNRTLDMAGYRYELGRASLLQIARAGEGETAFALPPEVPEHGERIAAYYWWVFPNLMLNFYPWGLSVNVVVPLAPARTRVLFRSFVADASLLGEGAGSALDTVELEDEAVVLGVQRGVRSRLYSHGRYAPRHEAGVHLFHRLVAEFMGDD